jgi:outer membrane lipoprotein-sorting protein
LAIYHDSRICNFAAFSTSFNKTAYTAALTIAQNGATNTATLKSDGKGNTELTTSSNGETLNAITLDNIEYIQNNGSGPWIEYNTGTTAPTTNPTSSMNIGVGNSGITFKYIDTESCGSLTCYKYKVTDASTPSATQYVWFDNSSYKLRQWQYTDGSGNTTNMTVTYNAVNITKPSPVESLSAAE